MKRTASSDGAGGASWRLGTPPGCLGRDTKVNRSLAERRRSFLERYAGIESGDECRRLAPALSAFITAPQSVAAALLP
jgi:hypothetical protein